MPCYETQEREVVSLLFPSRKELRCCGLVRSGQADVCCCDFEFLVSFFGLRVASFHFAPNSQYRSLVDDFWYGNYILVMSHANHVIRMILTVTADTASVRP